MTGSPFGHDGGQDASHFTGDPLGPSDPDRMGPFTLRARLGQGGMGAVYLAVGVHGETVALKVIHSGIADQPDFRARFAREVKSMQTVHGPFTAEVVAANLIGVPQWVAMEFVPGRTLADWVGATGPMPASQVRLLALGLAEALDSFQTAGVVHRDLKPSNVMLAADGPKIIDFGIADFVDGTRITGTGERLGSLPWMAPEQLHGGETTPAVDIHAWGQLVHFAATGTGAYGNGTPTAIAMRIMGEPPRLGTLPPELDDLQPILESALAQDTAKRPTAATLMDEIRAGIETPTSEVTTTSDVTRIVQDKWAPPPLPTVRLPPQRLARPNPRVTSAPEPAVTPASGSPWSVAAYTAIAVLIVGSLLGALIAFRPWETESTKSAPSGGSSAGTAAGAVNFPPGNSMWQVNNYAGEPDDAIVLAYRNNDVVCYEYLGPGDGDSFVGRATNGATGTELTGAIIENFSRPAKFAVTGTAQNLTLSEMDPTTGSEAAASSWRSVTLQEVLQVKPDQSADFVTKQANSMATECNAPQVKPN